MVVTLRPDIEKVVKDHAQRIGKAPEDLVNETLHVALALADPPARDEWEAKLMSIGVWTGVVLTDEQVSRDSIYEDHD